MPLFKKIYEAFINEHTQWPLWIPVFYGIGVYFYFIWPYEPSYLYIGIIFAIYLMLTPLVIKFRLYFFFIPILAILAALFITTLHANLIKSPQIPHKLANSWIYGKITDITPKTSGFRILLGDVHIANIEPRYTPKRIRINVHNLDNEIFIGTIVKLKADISPPLLPIIDNGYDFRRSAYFQQIGGVGYALSTITTFNPYNIKTSHNIYENVMNKLLSYRYKLSQHIVTIMGNKTGYITSALMVGNYSGLDTETLDDMRASGLAHILSVSGMHMTLVSAIFFFISRYLLTRSYFITEYFDCKKLAASISVIGSGLYLLISGMQVAALRAFIMTTLFLGAMLLDRHPVPMRSLAFAALAIMLLQPESLLNPSFQMSFAAVTTLIAVFEWFNKHNKQAIIHQSILRKCFKYILVVIGSSLIAGLATSPYALYHFNQSANFGILANVLATPLTSFIIMPLVIIALLLYPFNLDQPILWLLDHAIGIMLIIANKIANLPHAVTLIPSMSLPSIIIITFGGLWLCLWHGKLRYLGIAIMAVALLFKPPALPDIIMLPSGKNFAIKLTSGELAVSSQQFSSFIRDSWAHSYGQSKIISLAKIAKIEADTICNKYICLIERNKYKAIIIRGTYFDYNNLCEQNFDLILNTTSHNLTCSNKRIINFASNTNEGITSVYFEKHNIRVTNSANISKNRLWN